MIVPHQNPYTWVSPLPGPDRPVEYIVSSHTLRTSHWVYMVLAANCTCGSCLASKTPQAVRMPALLVPPDGFAEAKKQYPEAQTGILDEDGLFTLGTVN